MNVIQVEENRFGLLMGVSDPSGVKPCDYVCVSECVARLRVITILLYCVCLISIWFDLVPHRRSKKGPVRITTPFLGFPNVVLLLLPLLSIW